MVRPAFLDQAALRLILVLRPEQLWVTAGEPAGVGGRLAVTVTALTFCGPSLRCRARSVGGAELVADIGPHGPLAPRVGDRVWISWADGSAYLVPAATPALGIDLREPGVELRAVDGVAGDESRPRGARIPRRRQARWREARWRDA